MVYRKAQQWQGVFWVGFSGDNPPKKRQFAPAAGGGRVYCVWIKSLAPRSRI